MHKALKKNVELPISLYGEELLPSTEVGVAVAPKDHHAKGEVSERRLISCSIYYIPWSSDTAFPQQRPHSAHRHHVC